MSYRDFDPTSSEKTVIPIEQKRVTETRQPQLTQQNLWATMDNIPDSDNPFDKSRTFPPAGSSLLQLQNQFGNQYVQRLINPQQQLTIQPKLMLGDVDTPSEREADHIANQALRGGSVSMPSPVAGPATAVAPQTESAIRQAQGGGRPLPENTRTQMEQSLAADLSSVRIHTDSRADSLNQSLQARAFTTGQDIFFRRHEYNPGTSDGKSVLAHELTHVLQQAGDSSQALTQPNIVQRLAGYTGLTKEETQQENNALEGKYEFVNPPAVSSEPKSLKSLGRKKKVFPNLGASDYIKIKKDNTTLLVKAGQLFLNVLTMDYFTENYGTDSEGGRTSGGHLLKPNNESGANPYIFEIADGHHNFIWRMLTGQKVTMKLSSGDAANNLDNWHEMIWKDTDGHLRKKINAERHRKRMEEYQKSQEERYKNKSKSQNKSKAPKDNESN